MTRFDVPKSATVPATLGAMALALALTAAGPARALDDDGKRNIFSSVSELFTLGERPSEAIQYHDRAPLVIPPNMQQLPAPQAAAPGDEWMHDRKASGRRDLRAAARAGDRMRGTLAEPPNEYFRKAGNAPLPKDSDGTTKSQGTLGFLGSLNPFFKEEE